MGNIFIFRIINIGLALSRFWGQVGNFKRRPFSHGDVVLNQNSCYVLIALDGFEAVRTGFGDFEVATTILTSPDQLPHTSPTFVLT
jgi:hypothetical protein